MTIWVPLGIQIGVNEVGSTRSSSYTTQHMYAEVEISRYVG